MNEILQSNASSIVMFRKVWTILNKFRQQWMLSDLDSNSFRNRRLISQLSIEQDKNGNFALVDPFIL